MNQRKAVHPLIPITTEILAGVALNKGNGGHVRTT